MCAELLQRCWRSRYAISPRFAGENKGDGADWSVGGKCEVLDAGCPSGRSFGERLEVRSGGGNCIQMLIGRRKFTCCVAVRMLVGRLGRRLSSRGLKRLFSGSGDGGALRRRWGAMRDEGDGADWRFRGKCEVLDAGCPSGRRSGRPRAGLQRYMNGWGGVGSASWRP